MPRHSLRVCLSAFILVLAIVANARADVTRFDLSAPSWNGTGGVLPGVSVTLKNVDTGFVRPRSPTIRAATRLPR